MIPWSFCWNNIRLRPVRTLLTILSIAGGVAAVVAVLQSTAATRQQLDSLHQTLASRVSMEIVSEDAAAFSLADLPPVAEQSGVQAAIPVFRVFAVFVAGRQQVKGIALGVDLEQYKSIRDFEIVSGRKYATPTEVCLEAGLADRLGLSVGDDLRLRVRGQRGMLRRQIVGILKPSGIGAVEETASVFMPLAAAAQLEQALDSASSLKIVLRPGTNSDHIASQLKPQLPSHLILSKSASAADLSRPIEAMINVSLNVAAILSVVAAIFIVINTFQMSVTERQRQIALLRIVGATTDQVRASLYREALLLGGLGTVVGLGLGIAGSSALAQGLQGVFGLTHAVRVPIQTHALLAGVAFGPLVTLISVWHPARTACDAPPLRVLKSAIAPLRATSQRSAAGWGIATLCVAGVMFACTSLGIFVEETSIAGISLVLISSLIFLPSLIRPGSSLLFQVIGRFYPVEAQLGRSQLLDNFGRTTLTTAVLFVVSATSIGIGNTTLTVTADVQSWLDRTLTADFLLRASRPRVDMSASESLPDDLETRLSGISGIEFIDRISFSLAAIDGTTATLMTRQVAGYDELPIDLVSGDSDRVRELLLAEQAVLGTVLAQRLECQLGDTIRLEVSGVSHSIQVAGIAREYTSSGLMIIMDQAAAEKLFPIRPAQVYGIRTEPSATERVGQELRAVSREQGLIFQSLSDLRELVRGMISGLTSRLWMILTLALVIAGFAIVNTLTMSVIQQTRQLGVLRVVGMSRSQVLKMFLFQALVLGLLALVPGAIVGVLMAFLITISFQGVTELGVAFAVDLRLLGGYLAIGLTLSLLAATLPAIRAGRLKPLEAIHEE